jgi:hypothetical protein
MPDSPSPEVFFKHEAFDEERTQSYQFVCSLSAHQATVLVANREQQVLFLQRLLNRKALAPEEHLAEMLAPHPFLARDYMFRQVLVHSPRWILLPDKAYAVDAVYDLLAVEHTVDEDADECIMDAIAPLSVRTLYATPRHTLDRLRDLLPQVQFRHALSQVIRQTHRLQNRIGAAQVGYLEFVDYGCYYVVFRNGELQFGNYYRVATGDEAATYVREVNAALEIGPADITLGVAGVGPLLNPAQAALGAHYGTLLDVGAHFPQQPELQALRWHRSHLAHLLIPTS